MNIQKVAQRLGKSELTIRRWIKSGKLAATMTNGKWDISESALSDNISISNQNSIIDTEYLLEEIKFIRKENKQLRQQIEEKDRVLEDSRQRQDMIIMQLTRQMDSQLKLIEYKKVPWYRRLLKGKTTIGYFERRNGVL